MSTLVGAYKAERTKNLQLEEKRKNKEKLLAQIQRNQYLAFLEKKSATEAEDLKFRRESLQAAFANQEKFINEQQKEDARRLVKMRQRMRTILDTNFKSQ